MTVVPGPEPQLAPRIIGLIGAAGSGKDTVGNMLLDILPGQKLSLAGRFKAFCGEVFLFDENQLYGPSEYRNAIDERYSYDPVLPNWPIDFEARYSGFSGAFVKLLDWVRPERILPPPRPYTLEEIDAFRRGCWSRYARLEQSFLEDVVPWNVDIENARRQLLSVMNRILDSGQRNITPRLVLQLVGSEFGRAVDANIWVNRTIREAREIVASGRTAIITDVRFLNEAGGVSDVGGVLYYLEALEDGAAVESAGVAGHASEQELRTPKMRGYARHYILNDKSKGLAHLRDLVNATLMDG